MPVPVTRRMRRRRRRSRGGRRRPPGEAGHTPSMRRWRRRTLATVLTRLPPPALRASAPLRFAGRCSAPLAAACSVRTPRGEEKKERGNTG
uniref:Uncharacterized protein n=1 Tax=Oryza glumipatula TaxID=40148 RepID=A0A0D9YHR6_9ORYZ